MTVSASARGFVSLQVCAWERECVCGWVSEWVGCKKIHCKIPNYNSTKEKTLIKTLLTAGAVGREVLMPGVDPCYSTWP